MTAWLGQANFTQLTAALSHLQAGELDADVLLDELDYGQSLILNTILQGLADPASLDWLPESPDGGSGG